MPDDSELDRGRGPPAGGPRKEGLEAILAKPVTLETDLVDFLIIAGAKKYFSELGTAADFQAQQRFNAEYRARMATTSRREKFLTGKVATLVEDAHYEGITTIGQLKTYLETQRWYGEARRAGITQYAGMETLSRLNQMLNRYGLGPIRP